MRFSPWPAQDGLQRPGISGLGVGTEMAVLRQTRANEPAGGQARCTASDAQTAHHKNAARGNTRRGAGGCACPVLVGFVSSPAAGGAKKKSITPHGHFNAADSNRRLLPARPDLCFLTPKRRLGGPARKPLYLNRHLDVGGWAVVSGDARCEVPVVHFSEFSNSERPFDLETPPSEPRSPALGQLWRPGCPIGTCLAKRVAAVLIPADPMETPQFVVDSGILKLWIWGSGPRGPRK